MVLKIGNEYKIKDKLRSELNANTNIIRIISISNGNVTFRLGNDSFKLHINLVSDNIIPENNVIFTDTITQPIKEEPKEEDKKEDKEEPKEEDKKEDKEEPKEEDKKEDKEEDKKDEKNGNSEEEDKDNNKDDGNRIVIRPKEEEDNSDPYEDPYGNDWNF